MQKESLVITDVAVAAAIKPAIYQLLKGGTTPISTGYGFHLTITLGGRVSNTRYILLTYLPLNTVDT